ncbi:MAG TPA: copper chaperone PCu(A)C, partial [Magnetospirillum sp.]|nr:copper chaperone PCu(A)C [Magnetospirillum sp.]
RQVPAIPVPAGEVTALKPGADHIMFITLNKPLSEGQTVPVTLVFAKAGRKVVDFPVVPLRTGAAPAQ